MGIWPDVLTDEEVHLRLEYYGNTELIVKEVSFIFLDPTGMKPFLHHLYEANMPSATLVQMPQDYQFSCVSHEKPGDAVGPDNCDGFPMYGGNEAKGIDDEECGQHLG